MGNSQVNSMPSIFYLGCVVSTIEKTIKNVKRGVILVGFCTIETSNNKLEKQVA